MSSKPFIAARIPEELNQVLNAHSKTTGESKTQALINALSQYLEVAYIATDRPQASADSSSLLSRIIRLEEIIEQIQEAHVVIEIDNDIDNKSIPDARSDNNTVISHDNTNQPKTGEEEIQSALFSINLDNVDNSIDNKRPEGALSTKELAEMTGIKENTVKSKSQKETAIEHNGIAYKPISKGTRGYWWVPQQNEE
jgi:hypothetical protein